MGQYQCWCSSRLYIRSAFIPIYINDLSDNLQGNPKLFADDKSLLSTVKVHKRKANNLNSDQKEINKWAFQWKMNFNPDPTKQVQKVIFSRKTTKKIHP